MKPGGLFGFTTYDFPEVREIPGPRRTGPIPIRIMTPETGSTGSISTTTVAE